MRYSGIIYNDVVNTDGVALCFFTQGCTHHCKGCFSKHTWGFNGGFELTNDIISQIKYVIKNYNYDYICLIGGDPMDNIEVSNYVVDICKEIRPDIKVWLYTGYEIDQIIRDDKKLKLLNRCNTIVVGEFIEELKDATLKFMGSSNQKIINIK